MQPQFIDTSLFNKTKHPTIQLLDKSKSEQIVLKFRQLGDFTFNFNLAKSPCRKSRGSHLKSNGNKFQSIMKNIRLHTANTPH